jgi:hypothetical protein
MLMVAMMAIAVMTIQGSIAVTASLNNITTSVKTRVVRDATDTAQAGVEEAKARLMAIQAANLAYIGDPSVTITPFLSWYFLTSSSWTFSKDSDYSAAFTNLIPIGTTGSSLINTSITANSAQRTLPYWAKIRHKFELDAEKAGHTTATRHYTDGDGSTAVHTGTNLGNVIYYGYRTSTDNTPVHFTICSTCTTNASPVELTRAYGQNGTSTKGIELEMARDVGPPLYAPLYSEGNVNFSSHSGSVNGTDNCGVGPNRPPLYLQNPATVSGSPSYSGTPSTPQSGTLDVNREQTIETMKAGATVITTDQDNANFGDSSRYVTLYTDTSSPYNANGLQIRNSIGYGTLLVKGDLILGGDVTWNGLIIATGVVTLKTPEDGGSKPLTVRGAILSNGVVTVNKAYNIRYDSCQIAKAMGVRPMKVIRWRTIQ